MEEEKIFKVSEFNEFVNLYLEGVGDVVVEGEISEIRVSQNKWLFATIKDKDSSVEVFSITYKISSYDILETGMMVHVHGAPRIYKKTGRFSIFAENIVPAGEGALRLVFEKLKLKLEEEGLFDPQRKRQLPAFPERIGLITAKNSRAYSDFVKILGNRMGGIKIYFCPVSVQGKEAVKEIVGAFDYFNKEFKDLDALVLARGGGSLEDLQAFNDERVARSIFSSKFPVVCGIGHEDDVSIADLTADVRASTPSNAAEVLVKDRRAVLSEVNFYVVQMNQFIDRVLSEHKGLIERSVNVLKHQIEMRLSSLQARIAGFKTRFVLYEKYVGGWIDNIDMIKRRLGWNVDNWLKQKRTSVETLLRVLGNLDYRKVLERGFSITVGANGRIIKSIKNVKKDEAVTTSLYDGRIYSRVLRMNKN